MYERTYLYDNTCMNKFISYFSFFYGKRYLLFQLIKRDFTQKYIESYLGLWWALLEPVTTALILSVIFTYGYKSGSVQDVPFFIYMFTGIVAFNFFQMTTIEGTSVIRNYAFLVKKVNFKLSLLPIMKNLSCSIFHFIMVAILVVVLLFAGYYPTYYWLQFFYYFLGMNILVLGISFLNSALCVFIPDLRQVVSISLQFIFYLSPILWSNESIPSQWGQILKFNPMFYVIKGYRDSFIFGRGFWLYPHETFLFWGTTLVILVTSFIVFKRLRPHFADVL